MIECLNKVICTTPARIVERDHHFRPSLANYRWDASNAAVCLGKTHIVTNGDQTDTIYDLMSQGKSFADALRTRTFEPDGPNYTPRISAVVYADGSYQMSILKSADGNGDSVQRYFFDYPQPVAGEGHFISTYKHNGNPIPSFEGEPLRFACPRTIGDFAHDMWSSLNLDNKVSLFARVIDLDTGESGDMIFNSLPNDAATMPLPTPEITPPVTMIIFFIFFTFFFFKSNLEIRKVERKMLITYSRMLLLVLLQIYSQIF